MAQAPALLGFDDTIDWFCHEEQNWFFNNQIYGCEGSRVSNPRHKPDAHTLEVSVKSSQLRLVSSLHEVFTYEYGVTRVVAFTRIRLSGFVNPYCIACAPNLQAEQPDNNTACACRY